MATEYNSGYTDAQSVNNNGESSFTFKDINLFFSPNPVTKDISTVSDAQAIKRSVRNLVLLNPGEKPFHPEIGTGIRGAMFENFTPIILSNLRTKIKDTIDRYEPRVTLTSINFGVEEQNLDNNTLACTISFIIKNTPNRLEEVEVLLKRIR
jgi:hypothetical protein